MSEESALPPVEDDEELARFVLRKEWVRSSDQSIKPEAFIPHPYPDLSVTRHRGLSKTELWEIGQAVADKRPATLYGSADIRASVVKDQALRCVPTREPRNHVNITGWPVDKPAQKIIAQEIAATAKYVPKPPSVMTPEKEN